MKTLDEIRHLLDLPLPECLGEETEEDRMILQDDGSRACISYELAGKGYHLVSEREMGVGSRL
jgi:hypothetical protein